MTSIIIILVIIVAAPLDSTTGELNRSRCLARRQS